MSNPMFRDKVYQEAIIDEGQMTITGSVSKTAVLLLLAVATATYTWDFVMKGLLDKATMFMWGGIIVGFISVIIASFKPKWSNILAPLYAVSEGLALGGISASYSSLYNGIIVQAFGATLITMGIMLFLYGTRLIQATDKFRRILLTATLSIAIFYLLVMVASFFRIQFLAPFINAYNNIFVICFVIIVASMNLILDFDFIEKGSQTYAPRYFEWYGAMGLMVTLVWLYIEFLRLFSKLRRN